MSSTIRFGASVRGPAHVRAGTPNQDAWMTRRVHGCDVLVVADGMGSRPLSQIGSVSACRAVVDALRIWLPNQGSGSLVLAGLIQTSWRAHINATSPDDAATTCAFAFLSPSGGLVGRIGDGLALWRVSGSIESLSSTPDRAAANETDALGVTRTLGAWRFAELLSDTTAVALCTDGISEDLLPDRYDTFMDWLHSDLAPLRPAIRRRRLRNALENWPTPRHLDDKTLAYMEFRP